MYVLSRIPVYRTLVCVLILILAVGCTAEAAPSGSSSPPSDPLDVLVLPAEEPVDIRTAIAGQRSIFLVRVEGGPAGEPIDITATAPGARVAVAPETIEPGTVAEVTVIPDATTEERILDVTITVRRGSAVHTEARTLPVWVEQNYLDPEARERFGVFAAWLATAHPELGITPDTTWEGTPLQPKMLVVSHYLFLSEDWEVALEWHVMIAPHDWSRIYLRRRWTEEKPSLGFEITSVSAGDEPVAFDPAAVIER